MNRPLKAETRVRFPLWPPIESASYDDPLPSLPAQCHHSVTVFFPVQHQDSLPELLWVEMTIARGHPQVLMPQKLFDRIDVDPSLDEVRREIMSQVVEPQILNSCPLAGSSESD